MGFSVLRNEVGNGEDADERWDRVPSSRSFHQNQKDKNNTIDNSANCAYHPLVDISLREREAFLILLFKTDPEPHSTRHPDQLGLLPVGLFPSSVAKLLPSIPSVALRVRACAQAASFEVKSLSSVLHSPPLPTLSLPSRRTLSTCLTQLCTPSATLSNGSSAPTHTTLQSGVCWLSPEWTLSRLHPALYLVRSMSDLLPLDSHHL